MLIAGLMVVGWVMIGLFAALGAPMGYQDDKGFHAEQESGNK
jgi:hypothetical protein